jgi:conjugative transfer signal peptidase TraF
MSATVDQVERPLVTPDEVMRLRPPTKSGHGAAERIAALLKPIVAVAGDRVVLADEGMRVNGRLLPKTAPLFRDASGRSLHPWPFGLYVVEDGAVWMASTYNRGSYDSRYMGPIKISQIRARLRPLWLL